MTFGGHMAFCIVCVRVCGNRAAITFAKEVCNKLRSAAAT